MLNDSTENFHLRNSGCSPVLGISDERGRDRRTERKTENEQTSERYFLLFFINEGNEINTILFYIQPSGKQSKTQTDRQRKCSNVCFAEE